MPIRTTIQRHRAQWVLNALEQVKPDSLQSRAFVSWVTANEKLLGVRLPSAFTILEQPRQKEKGISPSLTSVDNDPANEQPSLKQKRVKRYETVKVVY